MAACGPLLRPGAGHGPAVLVAAAAAARPQREAPRPCRPLGRLRLPEVPRRVAAPRLRAAATSKPQRGQVAPTTRWRAARVIVVVAAYVSTDLGVFTCTDLAGGGFLRPAVMCLSAFSAFLLGTGVSWLRDGYKGLLAALQPSRWLALLPVSGMFCLGTWCTLHAVARLSPVFVKVLLQLNLPVTAFLSMLILKRRYTTLQVQALRNAFLTVIAFTTLRLDGQGNPFRGNANVEVGIFFTVLALFANASATLFAEKAMKRETPWYTTFAQIKAGDALCSFALLCLLPGAPLRLHDLRRPSLLFEGFSPAVWQLATVLVFDAWMSAMVVKQLSSVVKALAKGLSMLMLYLVVQRFFHLTGEPVHLSMVLLAILLVCVLQDFAYASLLRERQERESRLAEHRGGDTAARPRGVPKDSGLGDNRGVLLESLSNEEKQRLIERAAMARVVTIASRQFGRGSDFFCGDPEVGRNGGTAVLQAFFSDEKSEEVQIQGRTARQGQQGTYSLVLSTADLEEKFGIDARDLKNRPPREVYEELDRLRDERHREDAQKVKEDLAEAEERDAMSHELFNAVLDPSRRAECPKLLDELNKRVGDAAGGRERRRIILLLDATGSMQFVWDEATQCLQETFQRIQEIGGDCFDMQIVAYRDYGDTPLLHESERTLDASELKEFVGGISCDGGGGEEAVEAALAFVNQEHSQEEPVTKVVLIGDAPPHPQKAGEALPKNGNHILETDYKMEVEKLARENITVDAFWMRWGTHRNKWAEDPFQWIATNTGGQSAELKDAEQLIDVICESTLEDVGGEELVREYREKYKQ